MSKYIDFDDPVNRDTYVGRSADPAWISLFRTLTNPEGRLIGDIGCGGGIYTKALARLTDTMVIAIDSAEVSLTSATEYCADLQNIAFLRTDAESLGLMDDCFDLIVERALIHHFASVEANFAEAFRVLKPDSRLWLQDRTIVDVLLPPSDEHIRGFYLTFDESLRRTEIERRREEQQVSQSLVATGFRDVQSRKFRELRKVFASPSELRDEIVTRRGRSLLHGLHAHELSDLADYVLNRITKWPVYERDTWTVWIARK